MKFEQFIQAITLACKTLNTEILVFGSQAIHGNFIYADQIRDLAVSTEIDLSPLAPSANVDLLETIFGTYRDSFGYDMDIFDFQSAKLPEGWRDRVVRIGVPGSNGFPLTALCLEINDIIASKLARFEDKDREYAKAAI